MNSKPSVCIPVLSQLALSFLIGSFESIPNASWPVCQWPTCKASTLPPDSETGDSFYKYILQRLSRILSFLKWQMSGDDKKLFASHTFLYNSMISSWYLTNINNNHRLVINTMYKNTPAFYVHDHWYSFSTLCWSTKLSIKNGIFTLLIQFLLKNLSISKGKHAD